MRGKTPGRSARASLQAVPTPPVTPAPAQVEFRGRRKLSLIRDLAMGEHSNKTLALRYDAIPADIERFRHEYDEEIQEVSAALSGTISIETAGMWAARKQQRIAEYQQAIDDINETLESLRENGIPWSRSHRDMYRARLDYYRQIADELGAYPQRQAAPIRQGMQVQYVIESEDSEAMT